MDESHILPLAREYGLNHGFTFGIEQDGSRSITSFARSDRDFNQDEVDEISAIALHLHARTADIKDLSADELNQLKTLSVIYTRG